MSCICKAYPALVRVDCPVHGDEGPYGPKRNTSRVAEAAEPRNFEFECLPCSRPLGTLHVKGAPEAFARLDLKDGVDFYLRCPQCGEMRKFIPVGCATS